MDWNVLENEFLKYYGGWAPKFGVNPNPYDPRHKYDYWRAWLSGALPDETGHWPSRFKGPGHPNRFINGIDTILSGPKESYRQYQEMGERTRGDIANVPVVGPSLLSLLDKIDEMISVPGIDMTMGFISGPKGLKLGKQPKVLKPEAKAPQELVVDKEIQDIIRSEVQKVIRPSKKGPSRRGGGLLDFLKGERGSISGKPSGKSTVTLWDKKSSTFYNPKMSEKLDPGTKMFLKDQFGLSEKEMGKWTFGDYEEYMKKAIERIQAASGGQTLGRPQTEQGISSELKRFLTGKTGERGSISNKPIKLYPQDNIITVRKEHFPTSKEGDAVVVPLGQGSVKGKIVGTGKYDTHLLVEIKKGTPIVEEKGSLLDLLKGE